MSESHIKIEEGTVVSSTMRGAQLNRDGAVLEGPRIFVTFKFPLERVEAHLGTIARLIKRDRVIKFLEFKFIEQLEFEALKDPTPAAPAQPRLTDPLGTFPKDKPGAEKNGHQPTDKGKLEHIGKTAGKVAKDAKKRGGKAKV